MVFSFHVSLRGKVTKCRQTCTWQCDSPVVESWDFGRKLQILLKPELKGLSNGANDVLGQPVTALQDVTSCGSQRHGPIRDERGSSSGSCMRAPPRDHISHGQEVCEPSVVCSGHAACRLIPGDPPAVQCHQQSHSSVAYSLQT